MMNSKQVTSLIKAVGSKRTVLVEGPMGSGKSSIFHALMRDPQFKGYHGSMVDCTQLSDGSVWMPDIDRSRSISRELPNERFGVHEENHAGIPGSKPVLICLDEVGKTRQFIKDTLAPIVYERRIGQYRLPEGSVVFATTNLSEEGLGDNMLPHLRNRLTVVGMRCPTQPEWVQDFAIPNGLDELIITATHQYPMVFDSFTDYQPGGKYASKTLSKDNPYIQDPHDAAQEQVVTPRSLHAASDILLNRGGIDDETLTQALAGTVGAPFAANIMSLMRFGNMLPDYDWVVADPVKCPMPTNPTCCIIQCFQFIKRCASKEEAEACSVYVTRMAGEMKALFVNTVANSSGASCGKFAMSATFALLLRDNKAYAV